MVCSANRIFLAKKFNLKPLRVLQFGPLEKPWKVKKRITTLNVGYDFTKKKKK